MTQEAVLITGEEDITAHFEAMNNSIKRGAESLVAAMSSANVDFKNLEAPAWVSKTTKIGGKKLRVEIFTGATVTGAMTAHQKRPIASMVQVWNGANSLLLGFGPEQLEDARYNWNGKARIKSNDVVSQTIAALRLNSNQAVIHQLAMWCAYENVGVDMNGCHAVWD